MVSFLALGFVYGLVCCLRIKDLCCFSKYQIQLMKWIPNRKFDFKETCKNLNLSLDHIKWRLFQQTIQPKPTNRLPDQSSNQPTNMRGQGEVTLRIVLPWMLYDILSCILAGDNLLQDDNNLHWIIGLVGCNQYMTKTLLHYKDLYKYKDVFFLNNWCY